MVVIIHCHPLEDVNYNIFSLINQIFPRIAVPCFFIISGYFFTSTIKKGNRAVFKYIKRLLLVYTLWSIIYFFILLYSSRNDISIKFFTGFLLDFFLRGTFYHFWYFPSVIYSALLLWLCHKGKIIKPLILLTFAFYFIALLGTSYYNIGIKIPVMSAFFQAYWFDLVRRSFLMGLPFFTLGYLLNTYKFLFDKIKNRTVLYITAVLSVLFILEIAALFILGLNLNITVTAFLYPLSGAVILCCLKYPLNSIERYNHTFRVLSNFTYYSHPFFIFILRDLLSQLNIVNISETPLFILVCAATTAFSILFAKLNNKYINMFVL